MAEAMFEFDGSHYFPNSITRGPWSDHHLHGGPVSALLTRAIDAADPEPGPLRLVRLSIELSRPVTFDPLEVRAEIWRPGRKVQWIDATLTNARTGQELVRARGLKIREGDLGLDVDALPPYPTLPGPDEAYVDRDTGFANLRFHQDATDRLRGKAIDPDGSGMFWLRLHTPLLAGDMITPLERMVVAADFANGVSPLVARDGFTFINADLSIFVMRQPVGEWVALHGRSHYATQGIGVAESAIYDLTGRIGRTQQSLVVDRR
ncbi:MAG: thioesterase family protein [Acidimicrobiia bacterium]